jgi:thiol-disulfide isomerase/thioredoxin
MVLVRNRSGWLTVLAAFAAVSMAWGAEDAPTLKVGDPAPKLFVSKWLNGDAVQSFETDKIYVLECWATWCGPCRASIPHVSEMNTKFKDKGVVIIGMNVWEQDVAAVEPFIKEMGEKMNYRVAMDEAPGKTAEAWLKASGQDGIPCAFVVDKEGKVAWIGHPMNGMGRVIEQLVAGTFDIKKEAEMAAKRQDLQRRFQEAAQAKDADKLLALADEALIVDPDAAVQINMMKFQLLLMEKHDYPTAYALVTKLAENELKDNAEALNQIAWTILDGEGIEKRDLDLALKLATCADELTKHENAPVLDTLARAHFDKGQVAKAVELQTLAIEKAGDEDMKNEMKATLTKYQEKK